MTSSPDFTGKQIILGITGGIAAYKSAVLLRELQKSGVEVRCVMTPSATRFLGRDTVSALTRQPVPVEVFPDDADVRESWSRHIHWAEWADLVVIAPCTANTLAKIVHGMADNMLTSTVLAARCPVLICPTMDGGMYESPAMKRNRRLAAEMGYSILEPEHGYLASGLEDTGRLPENQSILSRIGTLLSDTGAQPLSGKKVVVTAGPTREYLDAVRFISNPSSGKMGLAMAEAARTLGANVSLIHGPIAGPLPKGIQTESFETAQEHFEAIRKHHTAADIFILAAAVSDFRPVHKADHKVKKDQAEATVKLEPTPDALHWLGKNRRNGQLLVGFAMETENLVEQATNKRERKKADFIVANTIGTGTTGFGHDTNEVYLIGDPEAFGDPVVFKGTKRGIALDLLRHLFSDSGYGHPKTE